MSEQHLSFDELAELAEGLLSRRHARTAQAHLDGCDECREKAAALSGVTTALQGLGPVAMPADVIAQLDRALATAAEAPQGDTVVPDLDAVRRRRQMPPRWLYASAAAVVVIGAVSAVVATSGRHHGTAVDTAAGNQTPLVATSAPTSFVQQESGQVYTPTSLAALAPGLVSGGLVAASSAGIAGTTSAPHQSESLKSADAGGGAGAAPNAPAPSQEQFSAVLIPRALQRYSSSRPALLSCAAFITDTPNAAPLAVDFARWSNPATHSQRVPALIMVFSDPVETDQLDVFVVGPACDDSSLLDFKVLPRP